MIIDNKEIYDKNWPSWLDMKIYGPASRWLRCLMNDLFDELPDQHKIATILDVGCGEGTNTFFMAQRFGDARVRGIDFSSTGIALARSRYSLPNLEFICDIDSRNLESEYDLITCLDVLEHVEDWQDLLGRMMSSSNKYVMLSFPTGRMRDFEINVGHVRNFKRQEVESFMAKSGFQPVKIYYAGFPFYSPCYRELCNLTNVPTNSFARGQYGFSQKITSAIFFALFRHFSTRQRFGDYFCGIFAR